MTTTETEFASCPECGAPAEITERFRMPSTDGLVEHIVMHCAAGHHFRMPAGRLPPQPRAAQRAAARRPAVPAAPRVPRTR